MPRVLFDAADGPPPIAGTLIALDERRSHHLVRVLRLAAGEPVEAFDGRGGRFQATIASADARRCLIRLDAPIDRCVESPLDVTLAQCLSTAEKMDWTIEKAVELGANAIAPLGSARSQVRLDAARAARKLEHWRHVVESACTQSGRARLPSLSPLQPLTAFLAAMSPAGAAGQSGQPEQGRPPAPAPSRRLVLAPQAGKPLSSAGIARGASLVLLVGPESGFSDDELRAACLAGFEPVTLGPRILRTETAGLAAIAALQALAGDF